MILVGIRPCAGHYHFFYFPSSLNFLPLLFIWGQCAFQYSNGYTQ